MTLDRVLDFHKIIKVKSETERATREERNVQYNLKGKVRLSATFVSDS